MHGVDYDDGWDSIPDPTMSVEAPSRMATRILDRAALADLPRMEPFIDGVLYLSSVAVLAGTWGSCKSFIALDWALSAATGRDWMGRRVKQTRVLYIVAEGAYGIDDRVTAWEFQWATNVPPDAFHVYPEAVQLSSPSQVTELCQVVTDGGYGLVVVDTLSKCMVGMDENSAKDMSIAVDALYRVQRAMPSGTVLVVHHTGKDKTTIRGSSALEGGVDTVYQTEGDATCVQVRRTKNKYGPVPDIYTLRLETHPEHLASGAMVSTRAADMTGSADKLMSVFVSAFSATGASKAQLREAAEMPPATFHRAVNALVGAGLLVNTGSDSRPFYVAREAQ